MTPEHTPTPWSVSGNMIWDANNYHVASCNVNNDAAFIVRACNAHDELVAACEEAIKAIELRISMQGAAGYLGNAYKKAKEALAKAKGNEP